MDAKNILSRRCNDNTTHLFKQFLRIVEELKREHDEFHKKLRAKLPSEYHALLEVGDFFDDAKMAYVRKKILDLGNETMRSSNSEFENFTVSFTFDN